MFSTTRRLLGVALLALTLTGTVAAQPAQTPEQSINARKMTIYNGTARTSHYHVADLNPIEALAYRRLEYLENQAELHGEVQQLSRLQVQRGLWGGLLQAPASCPFGQAPDGSAASDAAAQAMLNFGDLERAYLDVLNIERTRLVLPPLAPPGRP
jgi:hypothetical protein